MAQSAAAAAALNRSIETARRSGPGVDVSFVLMAFIFLPEDLPVVKGDFFYWEIFFSCAF
jgi:hypothetical protein